MTLGFAALGFAVPWALGALVVLPAIWWLLKVNPPAPRMIQFPAVRFLLGLRGEEQTPAKTPLWLLLLRLVIATLLILSVAGPLLNPSPRLAGQGPLLLIIDDGWASAIGWKNRIQTLITLIEQGARDDRNIIIARAAPDLSVDGDTSIEITDPLTAKAAREFAQALMPQPWPLDRDALLARLSLDEFQESIGEAALVAWLSDGLDAGSPTQTLEFAKGLQRFGPVKIYTEALSRRAMILLAPRNTGLGLIARVLRPEVGDASTVWVRATAEDGKLIDRVPIRFNPDDKLGEQPFNLPANLRNKIFRIDLEGIPGAGSVVLLDERWRRRTVGLISGGGFESHQPLLSDLYYLERALSPYNEVRYGDIGSLIHDDLSILMLADIGHLPEREQKTLATWVEEGGVLVRFAGPRLSTGVDSLVPVPLRNTGGRALGGALSWQEPMRLAAFDAASPFAELKIPDDVVINRQVLAEPSPEMSVRTWARLVDGTPLVTGLSKGDGWLVLFHTTANTDWSNLVLSGLFVDMLRRVVELGDEAGDEVGAALLPPLKVLDGFGRLGPPNVDSFSIQAAAVGNQAIDSAHPPGLYGTATIRRALNLGDQIDNLAPIEDLPLGIENVQLDGDLQISLRPWLMLVAIILAFADQVVALWMRGLLPMRRWGKVGPVTFFLLCPAVIQLMDGASVHAQTTNSDVGQSESLSDPNDAFLTDATRGVRLAYVVTGDDEVDSISRAGLVGLSWVLRQRTAVEPTRPAAVDPEADNLILYPLLYWPITDQQSLLSASALANIDHYLQVGGMILLDTRDQAVNERPKAAGQRSTNLLQQMLGNLNLPSLSMVPQGHALTQSFYLIDHFPGRWDGGDVWVEQYEGGINDGVSSLVVGGNDWAAAWALSPSGNPLFPAVPGGERQRELAFRFGINLTMYALTGNYKADQVHIPAILRRLKRGEANTAK